MARRGGQHNNNTNRFGPITPPHDCDPHPRVQYTMDDLTVHIFFAMETILVWFLFPIFNGSNYNTWRRSMLIALNAKNKLDFVDGSLSQPSATNLLFGICSRCNSLVISWLLNLVDREIGDSLLYMDSAHAVWTDLYDRFHWSNAPRVFQIKQRLLEQQRALESNLSSISSFPESMVFSAISSTSFVVAISSQSMKRNDSPICSHCGIMGYIVDRCYKLHRYPPGYKPMGKAQQQQQSSLQSSNKTCVSSSTAVPSSFAMTTTASSSSSDHLTTDQCQQLIAYLSTQLH
ncbi:hypothetical protein JRO89_XS01G0175800 [Xanthoceras sorbifolium]|uniref:Retrotransposon Copia-like N-terminal domain-containing protein n=1 Tax=Xanthoceras sorbifolium TaxID=99658 RepID=A0ABQ8IJP1_9ROSI|nr:hypothetical protein JRO89_XS01G0175800 [Xanthoceras sorbifolium]